jgi:hypothetical protein
MERENAVINNAITLRNYFKFSQTGDYFDPYAIAKVEILDSNGTTILETLTGASIVKDATGKYHVVASAITTAKTIYDKWYFTPSLGATQLTKTNTCSVWSTVAGSSSDLVTLAQLRAYLKKQTADTADDSLLESIITRVSADIAKKCNRTFAAASITEYHKGNGKNELLVRNPPVNSVTSIHVDSERAWGADTQIDSGDIVISDEVPGLITLDDDYFDKENYENVRIIYNGGYTSIPDDIQRNCLRLCACDYLEASRLNNKVEGEQDYDKMREKAWKEILNNYKITNV